MGIFEDLAGQFLHLQLELFDPGPHEVAELLKSGRADIGIMIEQETYPQGFHFIGIGHSQLIPVCARQHPLAMLDKVSLADLREYRQLITRSLSATSQIDKKEQVSPQLWVGESPFLTMDLVLAGIGWSELPWTVANEKLATGELLRLNYDYQQSNILQGVDLVWTNQRALGPSSQWLLRSLQELPAELWMEQNYTAGDKTSLTSPSIKNRN
jgi:DNA-binding transcriptional LysR family regulator